MPKISKTGTSSYYLFLNFCDMALFIFTGKINRILRFYSFKQLFLTIFVTFFRMLIFAKKVVLYKIFAYFL